MSNERLLIPGPRYQPGIEKRPVRAVLSDVDDTIVRSFAPNLPTSRVTQAFRDTSESVPTGIATARNINSGGYLIPHLGLSGLSVFNNGAEVMDHRPGADRLMVVERIIPAGSVTGIVHELQVRGMGHVIQDGGVDHTWVPQSTDAMLRRSTKEGLGTYKKPVDAAHPEAGATEIQSYVPQKPFIIFVDNIQPDQIAEVEELATGFESAKAIVGKMNKDGTCNMFITHPQANKQDAMGVVAEELGEHTQFPLEGFLTLGDGPNDKVLVENAELGVAMGNGVPKTREVAVFIAPTMQEDGAAVALEELVLNK